MNISKKFIIYFLFVSSLFLGFIFEENSSGGAKIDNQFLLPFIIAISKNFSEGLELFFSSGGSLIHSPVFYILNGYLLKISNSLFFIQFLNIGISCFLPYIIYECLKLKYKIDNKTIFYLSIIIFLSPFFRSSAIWLSGDNLSLLFFSISIFYYLKTIHKKNIINYYLCLFFLILCCYIRYYYSLFIIYYFFNFIKDDKNNLLIKLIIFSFLCSLPAISYFLYIFENYDFLKLLENKVSIDYFDNLLIILTIIFFYILPFIVFFFKDIIFYYKDKKKIVCSVFLFFFISYFINDFHLNIPFGGGVFVKLFQELNLNVLIGLYFISFLSILSIDFLFKHLRFRNYFLIITLIFCFPLDIIYQKYLDPLFIILFYTILDPIVLKKLILSDDNKIYFIKSYFFIFLFFSISYYL